MHSSKIKRYKSKLFALRRPLSLIIRIQGRVTKLSHKTCLVYAKKWKLNINLKKSKVLIFGTPTQKRWYSTSIWTFGKNILEQVN
jgi:hypothetical protein